MVARTVAPPGSFTAGWVRLTLQPCPGTAAAAPAGRLEVVGADRLLAFAPGRPGGATAALLTATPTLAPRHPQRFDLPPGSAHAREVVLAPWPAPGAPPRLGGLRLLAAAP